jgi:hypothetical protein
MVDGVKRHCGLVLALVIFFFTPYIMVDERQAGKEGATVAW